MQTGTEGANFSRAEQSKGIAGHDGGGLFGWYWRPIVAQLRHEGNVNHKGLQFVCGNELFEKISTAAIDTPVVWLVDDPENLERLDEQHLGMIENIYSPLFPSEWGPTPQLQPQSRAMSLAKTLFVPFAPTPVVDAGGELAVRTSDFGVSAVKGPNLPGVVIWMATFRDVVPSPVHVAAAAAAIGSLGEASKCWVLPPPLQQINPERLAWLRSKGVSVIPCVSLREGVTAAIQHVKEPRDRTAPDDPVATPLRDEVMRSVCDIVFSDDPPIRAYRLSRDAISRISGLAEVEATEREEAPFDPAGESLEDALSAWEQGRCDLRHVASRFVATRAWFSASASDENWKHLLGQSPQTPAEFLGHLFAQLTLTETYHERSDRARTVAGFALELLGRNVEEPHLGAECMRLLALAVRHEQTDFEWHFQRSHPHLGEGYVLRALVVASLAGLAWVPPIPSVETMNLREIPSGLALSSALSLARHGQWTDALAMIGRVHDRDARFFMHSAEPGRWNRFVIWGALTAAFGRTEESEQVLKWARSIDFTIEDQAFVLAREFPTCPASVQPLPRFELPRAVQPPLP